MVAQNANYEQNTVIVKVNANKVDTFFKSAYVTTLRERFGDFGYKLEFPDAVRPVKEYDNYGRRLSDITTIYRLVFESDIDYGNLNDLSSIFKKYLKKEELSKTK